MSSPAGHKLWVAGERVDADDLQGYLQDQVVAVFATTAARDAAITAPAEGMLAAITGTDRLYVYSGSAWIIVGHWSTSGRVGCRLRRAANQSTSTGGSTNISWDTEDEDTDGFIAVTSATITIPTGMDGLYAVSARCAAASSMGATNVLDITTSGLSSSGTFNGFNIANASLITPLAAGNTIVCSVYQSSGGAVNVTASLQAYRVGR